MKDEGSKGTVVGMAVLGVIGFFAFSFTIVGGIAGGVLGIILGRYAGKKIVRKAKNKTLLTEFELFTTKLECLLKWMKLEKKKCQFNINSYRLVLEKVRKCQYIKILSRLADILNNVFVPLFKIFSFQSDKKMFQKFTLLMKLQKLLTEYNFIKF